MRSLLLAAALCAVSAQLHAQSQHLSLSVSDFRLDKFLEMVSAQTKANFILGDGIPDLRVSFSFKNAPLSQVLDQLRQAKGLSSQKLAPGLYLIVSKPAALDGAKALDGIAAFDTAVTVNARQAPLQGLFDQVGEQTKTRFTVDEGLKDIRATLLLRRVTARQALQALCAIKGLAVHISGSGSFIVRPAAPASTAPAETQTPDAQGLYAGYRGASLPVSGNQLAFLKKGDHVDVMVTFEARMADQHKEKVTATILQNVLVVDLLKPAKNEDRGTVQLLLNPNEAQYAALSDAEGTIHIARRAPGDAAMPPMEMASFRKLFR
jgi:type II secretory pathway component GspD/PulD (secretin)